MVAKVRDKIGRDIVLFPNWTDVNSFYPIKNRDEIKKKYSFLPSDKIILYSGAIGEKQGLDSILHIANQLRDVKGLKFIICGSGPYKKNLQEMATNLNLQNVNFMPLQPHSEFNNFLNLADVHLVIQKAGALDLVMPSKLTTILAVGGLAVITATPESGLHALVKKHNIGVLADTENTDDLKECILKVAQNDFSNININARKYAEEYLSTDRILRAYESAIQNGKAEYGRSHFAKPTVKVGTVAPSMPGVRDSNPSQQSI